MDMDEFGMLLAEDSAAAMAAWQAGEVDGPGGAVERSRHERLVEQNRRDREWRDALSGRRTVSAEAADRFLSAEEPWKEARDAAEAAAADAGRRAKELLAEREKARQQAMAAEREARNKAARKAFEADGLKAVGRLEQDDVSRFKEYRAEAEAGVPGAREKADAIIRRQVRGGRS